LAERADLALLKLRCLLVLAPDRVVHFFSVDRDMGRGLDPEAHFVTSNIHNGQLDVVTDHDCLVALT